MKYECDTGSVCDPFHKTTSRVHYVTSTGHVLHPQQLWRTKNFPKCYLNISHSRCTLVDSLYPESERSIFISVIFSSLAGDLFYFSYF